MEREELCKKIAEALQKRPEVLEAYLFGSQARDEVQPHSDVDVAVYVEPEALKRPSHWGLQIEIASDLMTAVHRNDVDVDVVLLNRSDPFLYHRVLRDGVRLFARDLRATTVREGQALSRYFDDLARQDAAWAIRSARIRSGEFGR